MKRGALRQAILLLPLWLGLGACALNPATGGVDFMLVSHEEEIQIGRETHRQVLAEFGGVYYDPALSAYVSRVGGNLAAVTENQKLEYSFTILNTPMVNAFARWLCLRNPGASGVDQQRSGTGRGAGP